MQLPFVSLASLGKERYTPTNFTYLSNGNQPPSSWQHLSLHLPMTWCCPLSLNDALVERPRHEKAGQIISKHSCAIELDLPLCLGRYWATLSKPRSIQLHLLFKKIFGPPSHGEDDCVNLTEPAADHDRN